MALAYGAFIGGQGGSHFSYYGGVDGRVMQRIKVWAATSRIKAISVWLSDGVERTFGQPSRPAGEGELRTKEFSFNAGETVTSLSLWGNGAGKRSGWIYFRTSQNRTFDFGMYSWGKKTAYPQSVASGIWVGIRGRASADVDALGVVFLQPIQSCRIITVEYPTLQFSGTSDGTTSITPTTPAKFFNLQNTADQYDPSSTEQLACELADEPSFDNVPHSWSLSNTSTGLLQFISTSTISVQAHTPALAVVDDVVGWQLSASEIQSSSLSSSSSLSLPWSRDGSVFPSNSLALSTVPYRGNVSGLSFNALAQVTTTNGGTFFFSYGLQGAFTGQSYAIAISAPPVCQPMLTK